MEGIRTGTGIERWMKRVPDFRGCYMFLQCFDLAGRVTNREYGQEKHVEITRTVVKKTSLTRTLIMRKSYLVRDAL